MASGASFLSEQDGLVNNGAANRSRGLHTVRPSRTWFSTGPHVYVTGLTSVVYIDRL